MKNYLDIIEDLAKQKKQKVKQAELDKDRAAKELLQFRIESLGPIWDIVKELKAKYDRELFVFLFDSISRDNIQISPRSKYTQGNQLDLYVSNGGVLIIKGYISRLAAGTVDDVLPTLMDEVSKMLTHR